MQNILNKIASVEFFKKARHLIQLQANGAGEGTEKHAEVVDGLVAFLDDLDEVTERVPYIGVVLGQLVDSEDAQAMKRKLVEASVEYIYQTLKLDGAV